MHGVEFLLHQVVDDGGVGLAAGDSHDLAHQEFGGGFAPAQIVLHRLGVFVNSLPHGLVNHGGVAYLHVTLVFDDALWRLARLEGLLEDGLGEGVA